MGAEAVLTFFLELLAISIGGRGSCQANGTNVRQEHHPPEQ